MNEPTIFVKYHEEINKCTMTFSYNITKSISRFADILKLIPEIKPEDKLNLFLNGTEIVNMNEYISTYQGSCITNSLLRIINQTKCFQNEYHSFLRKFDNFLTSAEILDKNNDSLVETKTEEGEKRKRVPTNFLNMKRTNSPEKSIEKSTKKQKLCESKKRKGKKTISRELKSFISSPSLTHSSKINRSLLIKSKEKINLVLDLDETIVFVKDVEKLTNKIDSNIFEINIDGLFFKFKFRKYLLEFLRTVAEFCHLFIYTNALKPLAEAVISKINENSTVKIQKTNIIFAQEVKDRCPKTLAKFFPPTAFKNCLILDDNIEAWEPAFQENIIPTKKFFCFFQQKNLDRKKHENLFNYTYLYKVEDKKVLEFDNEFQKSINLDAHNVPYHVEYDYSEKSQLTYITNLLIRVFNLREEKSISCIESLSINTGIILKDCKVNLRYLDKSINRSLVCAIIKFLGGIVTSQENNSTHIIIGKTLRNTQREGKFYVNVKWIFDCYFFFEKFDEKHYSV